MKLLGYIRTCADELHNRIEAQDTLLHLFCVLNAQHTLVDVVVDKNISASLPFAKRLGGQQIMRQLQDGRARGLLLTGLNRAFDLNMNGLVQSLWFDQHGLSILTIQDHVDTSHPDGWRAFADKMIHAEYEYRKIQWQDKYTLYNTDTGHATLSYIPFGCVPENKIINATSTGKLYRDPIIWQIREIIMELYQQSMSPQHICEYLYKEQIPSPNGDPVWHVSTVLGIIESHDSLKCLPPRPDGQESASICN